ncbi:MAG: pyridoxamine 5'-phosphate oxidase family protein [Candidatus Omnitrophota bacterium]|nr:pyridoxamine 5'-phosphate oxidase family protein [Candidatus Omnitrophota bacterium]
MNIISDDVKRFILAQHFAIVSTVGTDGIPHSSCKGIVKINTDGTIYLLDLYMGQTYENLTINPSINLTAVDEHKFKGYCLKGTAEIVSSDKWKPDVLKAWEQRMASRITHRILRNIRGERGHPKHPEAQLPRPKYLIAITVKEVIDLTPPQLR